MDELTQKIRNVVTAKDYEKGLNYEESYIEYVGRNSVSNKKRHQFLVRSEKTVIRYLVQIILEGQEIVDCYCTCPQFEETDSCKHVAACLITYSDKLFPLPKKVDQFSITKDLFQKLEKEFVGTSKRKEEIQVIPSIIIQEGYYYRDVLLKVKIGLGKMYSLNNKFTSFYRAFEEEEPYTFGINFIYDPKVHFFSEQTLKLFQIMDRLSEKHYYGNSFNLEDNDILEILKIYPEGISINEGPILPIIHSLPLEIKLSQDDTSYQLTMKPKEKELKILTEKQEYLYSKKHIYHLNKRQQFLFKELVNNNIQNLQFSKTDFYQFQKNVFPIIKDSLVLDPSVENLVIVTHPDAKLYFDINAEEITCNPKFMYQNEEISYFEKKSNIIRDNEFEENIMEEIKQYGFELFDKEMNLQDLDLMCNFFENGLEELSEKYQVFTSEKFKNTNILKKNQVSTHFTIGKDQILHYDFALEGVSDEELENILSSLKMKKKYYRLKNGDILSLEQQELEELNELTTEFEISNQSGTIPKYRALYLESLKEQKYNIIETDSTFQKFIRQFQKYQNAKIEFSQEEQAILRDYQIEGVKWLYTVCKCGFGGILADEMGLGKSLQTIVFFKKILDTEPDAKFLIVCPTSLVYNWENEFLKFAPDLKFGVFAGNRAERKNKLQNVEKNIYITSYGLLREDIEFYKTISFRVFLIDEAQMIKNPKTNLTQVVKSITSETKMALTGTPIENSIVELWSIFDFIMPGFLNSLVRFQNKYKVKENFDEETNELLKKLKQQVKPFILRRKKKDVIKDLPDKIENNIYIDLNEEQKKVYAAEVKYINDEMTKLIANNGFQKSKMLILTLLTRLRQICIAPQMILENYEGPSAKMENLIKIIKEVILNDHKILLFTSFKKALDLVKKHLDEENISSYTIAGDVPSKKRQLLVDAFNKDRTNVFLIMLKSGGTGLNLTSADVVIHLDLWWNPQAENQATDRTHRIGQTKTVEVIKLICKGTIEEKILKLQEKKKILSDKIIEENMDDASYIDQLTEQEMRDLLAYENKD